MIGWTIISMLCMALLEARRQGVHSLCIAIDEEARDYLPHMYDRARYTIVDDV